MREVSLLIANENGDITRVRRRTTDTLEWQIPGLDGDSTVGSPGLDRHDPAFMLSTEAVELGRPRFSRNRANCHCGGFEKLCCSPPVPYLAVSGFDPNMNDATRMPTDHVDTIRSSSVADASADSPELWPRRSDTGPLALIHHDIVACTRCERLRSYCARVARDKKAAHRNDSYWGRPVPGFGDPEARVLVLGLAPAAHGANRTGRVFTGDGSGDFLMRAMHSAGFANITSSRRVDDGLMLRDAYIAAAVRCAPPDNKPTPREIQACHPHLVAETSALKHLSVIVALGRIGFDAAWRLLSERGISIRPRPQFGHGVEYEPADGPVVIGSYHPSRQNTNTGKLTAEMLAAVFAAARRAAEL